MTGKRVVHRKWAALWAVIFAVTVGPASAARAQSSRDFVVEKFQPMGGYYDVLGVESARLAPHLGVSAWAYLNESHQIVRLVQSQTGRSISLLTDQLVADVGATLGLFDWVEVGVALPIAAWQHGGSAGFVDPSLAEAPSAAGLADLRLTPKVALVRSDNLQLAISAPVGLPTGARETYLTAHAVTVSPQLLLAYGRGHGPRILVNAGYAFRPARNFVQAHVDSAVTYGAGAEIPLVDAFHLLAAVQGEVGMHESSVVARPVELQVAGKWMPGSSNWGFLAGAGSGFTEAFGAPLWRVLVGGYWRTPDGPPPDADGDGIPDAADACPGVPRGPHPDPHPQRAGCPEPDSDGDGVLDSVDLCPQVAAGPTPDPNRAGCPAGDRDGDQVVDYEDACPDTSGAPSRDPNKNGCPGLVKMKGSAIVTLKPIQFSTGTAHLLPASTPILTSVLDVLLKFDQVPMVSVEGHTDDRGAAKKNMALSEARAESCRAWLIAHGIAADKLQAHGFGPTRPIASNKTAAGRSENRRVEFHLDLPSPTAEPSPPGGAAPPPPHGH